MSRANKRWFRKKSIFQRGLNFRTPSFSRNMFSTRKKNWGKWLLIAAVVFVVIALACGFVFLGQKETISVDIQIADAVIFQDEKLPEVKVSASCEKENKIAQAFIDDIHAGDGYLIQTDADLALEGEYEISLRWNEEITNKLENDWKNKLKVNIQTGTLTVKNKFGEWDGDKFKKLDESYAINEFITSQGKEYYFDAEGNKVTGEYKINGFTYYFAEDGAFDVEKNKIHPGKPMIALTFDDGPGAYTEDLLSVLEENGARATFFVLGQQAKSFPTAIQKMKEIECEIGNHTYAHKRLTELSKKDMLSQINKTNSAVKSIIGEGTKFVRPTYGDVNSSVRKNVKYPLIMWSLDTEDWKLKDAEKITEAILSQVKDGDIILMHDIHDFTVEAMKTVIPKLIEEGYQLVTVSELAGTHGVTMKNGEKYFKF